MKLKEIEANVSYATFTLIEDNTDNRQLKDQDSCLNMEVSNQILSGCMKERDIKTNNSSNFDFTQLKGNAGNRNLQDPDLVVHAKVESNQTSSECMKVQFHGIKDILTSDLLLKQNAMEVSNPATSECVKLKEIEANKQLKCIVDDQLLEYPDLCVATEVIYQLPSECMKLKQAQANISSNSVVIQLEGNQANRQLEDQELCINTKEVLNQLPSEWMESKETDANMSSKYIFTQLEGNADNRQLEDPDLRANSKEVSNQISSVCMKMEEVGANISSNSNFIQLKGNADYVQLEYSGVLPSHNEECILSAPSPVSQKLTGEDLLSVEIAKTSSVKPSCCSLTFVSDGAGVGNMVDMSEKVTSNQSILSHGVLFSGTRKTAKEIEVGTEEENSIRSRAKHTKWASTHKSCSDSVGISYTASSTPIGTGYSVFQIDEVLPTAKSSRRKKQSHSPFIQKPFLPDLNASVSALTFICQPFSDLQQVQLYAQISVFGSLRENKPPVEKYMQLAFGEMDGGRRAWEAAWRKSVYRYQTQKSFLNPETPLPSHSVPRVHEQETKSPLVRSKVISTSVSRSTCKFISTATPRSPLPFPSRNLTLKSPTIAHLSFNQVLTPLHPNPSSQTWQSAYSSTPWISSNARPAPWVICSPSPALKLRHSLSGSAVDTVKVTPIRESSMPYTALFSSPMPADIPLDPQGTIANVQKSRKCKEAQQDMEDNSESILVSQPRLTSVVHRSPITLPYESPATKRHAMVPIEKIVAAIPHNLSPHNYQKKNSVSSAEIAKFSEEVRNKIEQAKLQAEEAASLAASVVSHSQIIWNQLATLKNSSLNSELEAKLVAAAAAGAATTSVARAAAVVAQVASETAIQTKLMADEAIDSAKTVLNPGSTPECKDKVHGFSLTAASDPTRIIFDETSVTTKQAKNLEAIVEAAGLAAEAVYHVGTLIAMGDPLPFNRSSLLEAGPDSSCGAYLKTNKLKDLEQSENAPSAVKKKQQTVFKDGEHQTVQSEENCDGSGIGKSSAFPNGSQENNLDNQKENTFRKGSLVEVTFDDDRLKGGEFSARVLDVEDNKVHVSYNNLRSDDGSAQLKEWISLVSETNGAPRIRNTHPHSVTQNDGTKKWQREVASDHVWEVGDHVDAWMHDGWWEGISTEKNRLDETKLKVHFPDICDSTVVQAWNLRTSVSWKDGQWTEWSHAKEGNLKPHEGDTPQEKRQKLDKNKNNTDTKVDGKVPSTLSKKSSLKNRKIAEKLRPLNIFINDASFVTKRKRTSPQKYMEISKCYYGSDKADKQNPGMDSLKFPKCFMPQSVHPWRNTSRTVPRGKNTADSTSVGVKPFRFLTANSRNAKQKDINKTVKAASYSEKQKSSVNKGDIGVKRRLPPVSEELLPDANEPRRSSRIIQPTARLLEGLQSL